MSWSWWRLDWETEGRWRKTPATDERALKVRRGWLWRRGEANPKETEYRTDLYGRVAPELKRQEKLSGRGSENYRSRCGKKWEEVRLPRTEKAEPLLCECGALRDCQVHPGLHCFFSLPVPLTTAISKRVWNQAQTRDWSTSAGQVDERISGAAETGQKVKHLTCMQLGSIPHTTAKCNLQDPHARQRWLRGPQH